MEKESENKLEVIKIGGNASPTLNEICADKEAKYKKKRAEETVANRTDFRNSRKSILLPYLAAAMMGPSPMNSPFDINPKEVLKTRKCVLPECDIYFIPKRSSETCCSKEHFFILRNIQKEKNKIHRSKKRKRK